jgi:hypothetical protein
VGFEPTIAVLERAKTVRALDRSTTAIGNVLTETKLFGTMGDEMLESSRILQNEELRNLLRSFKKPDTLQNLCFI